MRTNYYNEPARFTQPSGENPYQEQTADQIGNLEVRLEEARAAFAKAEREMEVLEEIVYSLEEKLNDAKRDYVRGYAQRERNEGP